MKSVLALLAAAAALASARAAIAADLITSLPGWDGPTPTKQYSGYFSVGGGKFLHYWFVESENDPATDPVVFWYNGGPGCSALGGFFTEQGPFSIEFNGSTPSLVTRPTRWNRIANTVFIEAPAGVGFSYAETPEGLVFNDTTTAVDNYAALQAFFTGFPEFATNDVYISGESYAGVYVPTLAQQVLDGNAAGAPNVPIKLVGLMVGNGCTGTEVGSCSPQGTEISVDFLGGMGMYSAELYSQLKSQCDLVTPDAGCMELLNQMADEVGPVNIYDIYAPCINSGLGDDDDSGASDSLDFATRPANHVERLLRERARTAGMKQLRGADAQPIPGPAECIDGGPSAQYLNTPAVRAAIHVASQATTGAWAVCTGKIDYTPTEPNEPRDIYPKFIANGIRVLIYEGDVDACVPWPGIEAWTSQFATDNKLAKLAAWHPWYAVNGANGQQVAGYATVYAKDFTFITIKGAGHMVPQFQPNFAYAFFERFLSGATF